MMSSPWVNMRLEIKSLYESDYILISEVIKNQRDPALKDRRSDLPLNPKVEEVKRTSIV